MERVCGGCTACCKTHAIYEIKKPPGKWCKHCNISVGCSIYATRPPSCQNYMCSWLLGIGLDEHRPDRIGIVGQYDRSELLGQALFIFEAEEGALQSEVCVRWSINNLWNGNCVIHRSLGKKHTIYLPRRIPRLPDKKFVFDSGEDVRQVSYNEAVIELSANYKPA